MKTLLKEHNGFARMYNGMGAIAVNKRGSGIKAMLASCKDDEKVIKSYRRYKRTIGKNVVSYIYFAIITKAFKAIANTPKGKQIFAELDSNPKVTFTSAIKLAQVLSSTLDAEANFWAGRKKAA